MRKTSAPDTVDNLYSDGDQEAGTLGSALPAEDLNILQSEIVNAIENAGLTLDQNNRWPTNDTQQLRKAIEKIAARSGVAGRNYISNTTAEENITGYSLYADGAAVPVDGTGGTATATFTATATSPLRGLKSFLYTPGALGNGVSCDFTLDAADKAQMLQVSFDYSIGGTGYAEGDLQVWVYAVDGSAGMIQLTPYKVSAGTSSMRYKGVFQTKSDSTSYRVLFHQATGTSSYTVKLDNLFCGPQPIAYASPVTEWTDYPSGATLWSASSGTQPAIGGGTLAAKWRRIGDEMEIRVTMLSGTGTTFGNAGVWYFHLPPGYAVDLAKIPGGGSCQAGTAKATKSGVGYHHGQVWFNNNDGTNKLRISDDDGAGTEYSYISPITWAIGDQLHIVASVPISGWGTSVQLGSDAEARIVAAVARTNGSTVSNTIPNVTEAIVDYNVIEQDSHGAIVGNGTASWRYVAPISGFYFLSASVFWDNPSGITVQYLRLYKNGVVYGQPFAYMNGGDSILSGTRMIFLNAGDYIAIRIYQSSSGSKLLYAQDYTSTFSVLRVAGPSQIAATETVCARYILAALTVPTGFEAIVGFASTDIDTHGAGTPGTSYNSANATWATPPRWTAPVSGKYRVSAGINFPNTTASFSGYFNLYKNGSLVSRSYNYKATTVSSMFHLTLNDIVSLQAGQYIDVRVAHDIPATNYTFITGSTGFAYLAIERIGN